MQEVIRFHLASTELTETHKNVLNSFVEGKTYNKLTIVGHACDTPVVTPESLAKYKDNFGFSRARADVVASYLVSVGVVAEKIVKNFEGDTKPLDVDRDNNRRVELSIE